MVRGIEGDDDIITHGLQIVNITFLLCLVLLHFQILREIRMDFEDEVVNFVKWCLINSENLEDGEMQDFTLETHGKSEEIALHCRLVRKHSSGSKCTWKKKSKFVRKKFPRLF